MAGGCERLVIEPSGRRRAVLRVIGAARRRLVLSIFRCDDSRVLRALAGASARGVHVSAIVTARARAAARDLERVCHWLIARGIEVRRPGAGAKYHAKYLVADERVAVVTSLNYTAKCFTRTCDFLLVTRDPAVVSGLTTLFAADWSAEPAVLTAAQRERLIVGPDHDPRARFASLMLEARHCVRLLDTKLTDRAISRVLDDCRQAGLTVEIARRRSLRPLRAHGKLLLIDDRAAVIGSLALSPASLDRRRELALVVRDLRLVATLDAFWRFHLEPTVGAAQHRAPGPFVELAS
jgi:phosphatidylserine/phosphatidylglycerophosphate/cardiolipin synthase-like enzyme